MPRSTVLSLPMTERRKVRASARDGLRSRLLASARTLFRDHPYEQVTIRMVAAHADVALGTVYNCFGSKGDLWRAAMDDGGLVERPVKRHANALAVALRAVVRAVRSGDTGAVESATRAAEVLLVRVEPTPAQAPRRAARPKPVPRK